MAVTLQEVEGYINTIAIPALDAAGYMEVAAFIPILEKLVEIGIQIAEQKKLHWDPAVVVQATEVGAMAELEAMKAGAK